MSQRVQPIYLREDEMIIPRAEYEALRYAARILATERPGHPAIAALRPASGGQDMSNKASSPATPWEPAANVTVKEPLVTIPRAQHEALMTDQWQRIRELEGGYLATLSRCDQLISAAEEQRDAIRAKTIEECLAEIIAAPDREEAIENIRALAQTDEGKT